MASRATTPTTAAAIVAAYVAGAPVKVICAQYFISRFVITQALKAAGVPRRPRGRPRTTKETRMLDELRRVVAAATPGPLYTGDADRATSIPYAGIAYTDEVFAHGAKDPHTPIATYERPEDAARAVAVANALPALLAVVEAARELEAATMDVDSANRDPMAGALGVLNAAYHREYAARAALWAALGATPNEGANDA